MQVEMCWKRKLGSVFNRPVTMQKVEEGLSSLRKTWGFGCRGLDRRQEASLVAFFFPVAVHGSSHGRKGGRVGYLSAKNDYPITTTSR